MKPKSIFLALLAPIVMSILIIPPLRSDAKPQGSESTSIWDFSKKNDKGYKELQEIESEWTNAQEYLLDAMADGASGHFKAMIFLGATLPAEEVREHNRLLAKAKKENDFETYLLIESRAILKYNEAALNDPDSVTVALTKVFEKLPEVRDTFHKILEVERKYKASLEE